MKNSYKLILLVSFVFITLSSCTNESVALSPFQLLKKIVEVYADGTTNTTLIAYEDNKIVTIDKVDKLLKFYYSGVLITKITELNKSNQHVNTLQYDYFNGQLTKITSSDNYVLNYIHNPDGSVAYEKLTKDSNTNDVKIYHGTLYFQNGNLIENDQFLDDTGSGFLSENKKNISYDSKNNALNNILGFNKLLDYSELISLNNPMSSVETSSVKNIGSDQVSSSINLYSSKYSYDSNNYPNEIVSQNILFGGNEIKHVKSQLFYD
jgi:hypothetical protein